MVGIVALVLSLVLGGLRVPELLGWVGTDPVEPAPSAWQQTNGVLRFDVPPTWRIWSDGFVFDVERPPALQFSSPATFGRRQCNPRGFLSWRAAAATATDARGANPTQVAADLSTQLATALFGGPGQPPTLTRTASGPFEVPVLRSKPVNGAHVAIRATRAAATTDPCVPAAGIVHVVAVPRADGGTYTVFVLYSIAGALDAHDERAILGSLRLGG